MPQKPIQQRLHARFDRLLLELDGAEQVAVIGHGHGGHLQLSDPIEERVVLDRSVEERVLRVQMQVDERTRHPPGPPFS